MISVLQSIRPRGYYWRIYKEEKGRFGSVFGFLMTMIGFAVGIGSLWRFPYICGTNGGALFIVTYIVAILFVGIPLLTAEMSMGFKSRRTAVGAYKELEPEGSKWHLTGFRIPGSSAGLKFLFNPDVSNFHFSSFTAALGQAFFAIGIGMLASMVFGSCVTNREEHLFKDCSIISVSIIIVGVFAGLMIFPICFAFNLEPAAGVSLSMITLPNAFNAVAGGRIIGKYSTSDSSLQHFRRRLAWRRRW